MHNIYDALTQALKSKNNVNGKDLFAEVGNMADLSNLSDYPPAHKLPACYLVPTNERADYDEFGKQLFAINIAVIIIITSIKKPHEVNFQFETYRAHVRNILTAEHGYTKPPYFTNGALQEMTPQHLVWRDNYALETLL